MVSFGSRVSGNFSGSLGPEIPTPAKSINSWFELTLEKLVHQLINTAREHVDSERWALLWADNLETQPSCHLCIGYINPLKHHFWSVKSHIIPPMIHWISPTQWSFGQLAPSPGTWRRGSGMGCRTSLLYGQGFPQNHNRSVGQSWPGPHRVNRKFQDFSYEPLLYLVHFTRVKKRGHTIQ